MVTLSMESKAILKRSKGLSGCRSKYSPSSFTNHAAIIEDLFQGQHEIINMLTELTSVHYHGLKTCPRVYRQLVKLRVYNLPFCCLHIQSSASSTHISAPAVAPIDRLCSFGACYIAREKVGIHLAALKCISPVAIAQSNNNLKGRCI